jgi:hypothetical protein
MAIRCLRDINEAFANGRWHLQRFIKNAGSSYTTQWADAGFQSGHPPANARIGIPLEFTPVEAERNQYIWFPGINSSETRYLASVTMRSNQSTFNSYASIVLFDLVGYYPMIDGDNDEEQTLDNTETLPRYTTGDGLALVFVNHVNAGTQNGVAVVSYTNSAGTSQSTTVAVSNNGLNLVGSGTGSTAATQTGAIGCALANGAKGVRSVQSVRFSTMPGGLWCLYLIKKLATVVGGDNTVAVEKEFFSTAGCRLPIIPDGAAISWFSRIGGSTARTVTWFGNFVFVWG